MGEFPLPSFDAFYQAVNEREPLPWQRNLAKTVASNGWPSGIGVPTGLGKTSCIDIAVWTLAAAADLPPNQRAVPTRVWYVVNRRLLVDAAYDHGKGLAERLARAEHQDPDANPLAAVAHRLRKMTAMGSEEPIPLHVGIVRGGAPRTGQVPDPSMPALLFATVPMYASRWLFEAYGSSPGNSPIEAALAGADSLVLLDESHLARPLRQLVEPLAACDPGGEPGLLHARRNRPQFVELSATGCVDSFNLGDEDYMHPVVQQRISAQKPTQLVESTKRRIHKDLAAAALNLILANSATSTLVFANSPRRARHVHTELSKLLTRKSLDAEVLLLTGRIREIEGRTIRERLLDAETGAPSSDPPVLPSRPLIIVATQTLEVGADIDVDHLVTETAGARALVQRFGRLNRIGLRDAAAAVICHPKDEGNDGLYGSEPSTVWNALQAAAEDQVLDLGPSNIRQAVGEPTDQPPRTGEVLPAHLWEWAKTSLPPPDRAPIELFVEGIEQPRPTVTVLWRVVLPALGNTEPETPEAAPRLVPRVHDHETVELALYEVREVLTAQEQPQAHKLIDDAVLAPLPCSEALVGHDEGWCSAVRAGLKPPVT